MTHQFQSQFDSRAAAFLEELDALVRLSVLEAVRSALSAGAAAEAFSARATGNRTGVAAAARAAASSHALNGHGSNGRSTTSRAPSQRRRPRRLDVVARDAAAIAGPLVALLQSSGGLRMEEITSRTRMPAARLQPLVDRLVAEGRLREEEHRHGTRYVAVG